MIDQISKLKDHVNVSIMKAVQVDESKKLNYWALKSCRIYCLNSAFTSTTKHGHYKT